MVWLQRDEGGKINGVYANRQEGFAEEEVPDDDPEVVAYLTPRDVPQTISDRQFFQQLAVEGIITEDQALASNAAVIPPPLLQIIEELPVEQQFAAKMIVSGATVFERTHPLTVAIGAAYGWDDTRIDGFFEAADLL